MSDLDDLTIAMREFSTQRDWQAFHDPKSLILALMGEVGELAELFQWLPANDAATLAKSEPLKTRVGEEISDVLLYLLRLADVIDLDLAAAATRKLKLAGQRFQIDEFKGSAPVKR